MHLALQHVSVAFGAVHALHEVSLDLPLGTQALLYGPSGCGKSTLLKCLAGLQRPTGGSVLWNGRSLSLFSVEERRAGQASLGFVFQSDALFDSMTVLDNVALPLRKRGVPEAEAVERAMTTLTRVRLAEAASKFPEALSGGMKKRVGIARAVVAKPTVLLADDPFAGLDPVTEREIAELLLEVSRGATLVAALPEAVESLPLALHLNLEHGALKAAAA